MRFYAVTSGGTDQAAALTKADYRRALVSYLYDKSRSFWRLMPHPLDLLIDSGAFTVWTKGKTVPVEEYRDYLLAYRQEMIEEAGAGELTIVNLDVIAGRRGQQPTRKEIARAVEEGMSNADCLRDAGLPIMEVFHRREELPVLEQLLARCRPGERVGLGALAGAGSLQDKRVFLDESFRLLRGYHGGWEGITPLHGLGISPGSPLSRLYPFYSCDAASWVFSRKFGKKPGRIGAWSHDDDRTAVGDVAEYYFLLALAKWRRNEEALTEMWERRGVTFAADERIAA